MMKNATLFALVLFLTPVSPMARGQGRFLPADVPANLGSNVNGSGPERGASISSDGLSFYYELSGDIVVSTRPSLNEPFGAPVPVAGDVNSPLNEAVPEISSDGLTLFFRSVDRPSLGASDLWMTTRASISDPFGTPESLGPIVNSEFIEDHPSISADGLTLYFNSNRPGGFGSDDIWMTQRASLTEPFGEPINLGPGVNTSFDERWPSVSGDERTLIYASVSASRFGGADLYTATRSHIDRPFEEGSFLSDNFNSGGNDNHPDITADGSTLYFSSSRPGGFGAVDIYAMPIIGPTIFDDGQSHTVGSEFNSGFINVYNGAGIGPTSVEIVDNANVVQDDIGNSVEVFDDSFALISGGTIEGDVEAHDNALIEIVGGVIDDDVQTEELGKIEIRGGIINGDVDARDSGHIVVYDVEVFDDVQALDSGRVDVFGGYFGEDIEAADNGSVHVHGGIIGPDDAADEQIQAFGNGVVTLYGTDFALLGLPLEPGPVLPLTGELSGVLSDGNSFDIVFVQDNPGQIVLSAPVPEPTSALLLALGTLFSTSSLRKRTSTWQRLQMRQNRY